MTGFIRLLCNVSARKSSCAVSSPKLCALLGSEESDLLLRIREYSRIYDNHLFEVFVKRIFSFFPQRARFSRIREFLCFLESRENDRSICSPRSCVLFLRPVKGTMLAIFRRSHLDCEIFESCHYRPFDKTPILHRRAWYLHARPRAQACKRELIARWKRQPAVAARNTKGYHCLFEIRLLVEPPFPNRPS